MPAPGQYEAAQGILQVLGDRFADVLAITVTGQSGPPIATFASIDLKRTNGVWVFVAGNPPGVSGGGTEPELFGIPAPPRTAGRFGVMVAAWCAHP
jgi:hypothetical protein